MQVRAQDVSPGLLQQTFAGLNVLLKRLLWAAHFVQFDLPTIHIKRFSEWVLAARHLFGWSLSKILGTNGD